MLVSVLTLTVKDGPLNTLLLLLAALNMEMSSTLGGRKYDNRFLDQEFSESMHT